MIVIKSIGWVEVEEDTYNIQESTPDSFSVPRDVLEGREISTVYGKRYRRADGTIIVLGNVPKVEELIGTQLKDTDRLVRALQTAKEDIGYLNNDRKSLLTTICELDKELYTLKGMGFWKRVGYALQLLKPSRGA